MSEDGYLKCNCKECGNHIAFPVASLGNTVACPHCGQWTELIVASPDLPASAPRARGKLTLGLVLGSAGLILTLGVVVLFLMRDRLKSATLPSKQPEMASVLATNPPLVTNSAKPPVSEKHQKSPGDLKFGQVELEKAKVGSLVFAVGTVTNASEFQRFGVQVELDLFGKDGKKLGTAKDYKDVIEPNREWQFHALIPDQRTASARVAAVRED